MFTAYKRIEEDIFFKTADEMHEYIMDNVDKNWKFVDKIKGNFSNSEEKFSYCLTVVKPVEGYTMGV